MVVYAIAIIPMILMIAGITTKIDDSSKTAAYAGKLFSKITGGKHFAC